MLPPVFLLAFILATNGASAAVHPFIQNRGIVGVLNEEYKDPFERCKNSRLAEEVAYDTPDYELVFNSPEPNARIENDERSGLYNIQLVDAELEYPRERISAFPTEKDDAVSGLPGKRFLPPHMGRPRRESAPDKATLMNSGLENPGEVDPGNDVVVNVGSYLGRVKGKLNLKWPLRQKVHWFYARPAVVQTPSEDGVGGAGISKFHTLRPLRPTSGDGDNIRSYNQRSMAIDPYPSANQHNPRLLWTGLG